MVVEVAEVVEEGMEVEEVGEAWRLVLVRLSQTSW